eukprot:343175_1
MAMTMIQMLSFVTSFLVFHSHGYLIQKEINALHDFYISFNGDKWTICKWNFTKLNITNHEYFIPVDEFENCGLFISGNSSSLNRLQTVSEIDIRFENNLNGTISPSIQWLSNLTYFELGSNHLIYGQIPTEICSLINLETLIFYNLTLYSTIPECIQNLSSIKVFALEFCPTIYDVFPQWICKLHQLQAFEFAQVGFNGTIPNCIGSLSDLTWIVLYNIPNLSGSIPKSISNLSKLVDLEFRDLPKLTGNVPYSLFSNNPNLKSFAITTNPLINLSISSAICDAVNLINVDIDGINVENSFIPECIGKLYDLQELHFAGYGLQGELPLSFCNLKNIWWIGIEHTSMSGKIPSCLSQLENLQFIMFSNNQFTGHFPSINSINLTLLSVYNNFFTGSISTIFVSDYYEQLEIVALDRNNFQDDDITFTLQKLFTYSKKLKAISLYNNDIISGHIPEISNNKLDSFQIITAHNLDIYGVLPSHMHLGRNVTNGEQTALILYNNRLSGAVPDGLEQSVDDLNVVMLSGNLFYINTDNIPLWMNNSLFISATNLFIDVWDLIKSYLITISSLFIFIFVMLHKIHYSYVRKLKNILRADDQLQNAFVEDISNIYRRLSDIKLLVLIICLLTFYPFCNNYYHSTPILSNFCLYFYHFQNDSIASKILLFLFVITFNILMATIINTYISKTLNSANLGYLGSFSKPKQQRLMEDYNAHNDDKEDMEFETEINRCWLYFKAITYMILYLCGIMLSIIYILAKSLPEDNVLRFTNITQNLTVGSISIVLAVVNAIIVPRFISSITKLWHCVKLNRNRTILALRTLTTIIIPIIFTIYYSNDCGSNWTTFWNPCTQKVNSPFDIEVDIKIPPYIVYYNCSESVKCTKYYNGFNYNFGVLSHSDVCDPNSFTTIKWNRCVRTFFYTWTEVILNKMFVMIFMPFAIIFYKTVLQKIKNYYYKRNKKVDIKVDCEYTMIITKMETMISFSLFCPLLIPVTIMALLSCQMFYTYVLSKLNWNLKFSYYTNISS